MVFPSVAVLRFQIFQKLPLPHVVLDVSLDKYAVHWAAQIGCPTSSVPYLLASQRSPKSSLLDDTNLAFRVKTRNGLRLFRDYFQILVVVIPQYPVLIWFNLSQFTK